MDGGSRPTICEACGAAPPGGGRSGIHMHHWSYAPEHADDLIPLCVSCHRRVHMGGLPEPRTGRVYNGERVKPEPDGAKVSVFARVSVETFDAIKDIAAREDRKVSSVVDRLLREALAARAKQAPR